MKGQSSNKQQIVLSCNNAAHNLCGEGSLKYENDHKETNLINNTLLQC